MAAALQYLKEHQLFEYDDLAAKTDAATEQFHTLAGDIQQTEAELSHVSNLMAAVVQYAKTRPAFDGYKAAKYSRKYLAEHEAELADYRANWQRGKKLFIWNTARPSRICGSWWQSRAAWIICAG